MIYVIRKDYGCEGFSDVAYLTYPEVQNMAALRSEYDISRWPNLKEVCDFAEWLKDKKGFVNASDSLEFVVFED